MAPKRARSTKASTPKQPKSSAAPRTKRASTAKASSRSFKNDVEIRSAFEMFAVPREEIELSDDERDDDDDDGDVVLKIADVRRCLSALDLPKPPPDFFDDPSQKYLTSTDFLALAQTLRDNPIADDDDSPAYSDPKDNQGPNNEVAHAFSLFTHDRQGEHVKITLADLRRVAKELREDVDDTTLRLMIEEANGEQGKESVGRGVDIRDFEEVMKRAKVFR